MLNISKNTNSNLNENSNTKRILYLNKNLINKQKSIFNPKYNTMKEYNEIEIKIFPIKDYDSEKQNTDKISPNKRILKKINTNLLCTYFCFCCSRKRKNIANTLLDEAMNIIKYKLDIYNMFRNMYYIDDIKQINNYKYKDIEFSNECKQKLEEISNKIYNLIYGV